MGTEDANGNPGNLGAGNTGAGADGNPPVGGAGGKVEFTPEQQQYVNQIVSQRVNEVKGKYAQTEEDSRILQNLLKDPEFVNWLNGDRSAPSGGGNGTGDPMEQLMNKEELSGKEVVQLVSQLLGKEIQPIKQTVDQLSNHTRAMGVDTTLQRLANQVDPRTGEALYPYLWDEGFRTEVQGLLGKRASNPEDAYHLALRDRERSGKGVPQTAFFLEGSGRGGRLPRGGGDDEEPETLEGLKLPAKANIKQILSALYDKRMAKGG